MTNVRNFCTLFDYRYLSRGLALYESLVSSCDKFQLFVYCFDADTYKILKTLNRPSLIPILFSNIENERLLSVKASRSFGEYCWTATPFIILHALKDYALSDCTYLDADTYFFSDPSILFEEIGSKSVGITPHWYSPAYNEEVLRGKYCVQFNYFKNNSDGLFVLNWWADRCIEWCSSVPEDGKFGDQKYLDNWMQEFGCVHEFSYRGGGVAPWNVQQYDIVNRNSLEFYDKNQSRNFKLVYYHFHALDYINSQSVSLGGYKLSAEHIECIYIPYVIHLEKIKELLCENFEKFRKSKTDNSNIKSKLRRFFYDPYVVFKYLIKRFNMQKNIIKISDLNIIDRG